MIEDHPLRPAPWSSRARMELNRDTFSSTSALRQLPRTLVRRVSYTVDVTKAFWGLPARRLPHLGTNALMPTIQWIDTSAHLTSPYG